MTTTTSPENITLARGSHPGDCDDPQRCLFEAYNWIKRHQHTDSCPPGVSRVLHQFGMRLNDALGDDRRQELKRYLPNGDDPLAGTAGDGKDTTRGYVAADWAVRAALPAWLDAAGLDGDAAKLRQLPRLDSADRARAAYKAVDAAWKIVRTARDEAWARLRGAADTTTAATAADTAAATAAADAAATVAAAAAAADTADTAAAAAAADTAATAAADTAATAADAATAATAATAAAAADTAADAADAADATATGGGVSWRETYDRVYKAVREAADAKLAPVTVRLQDEAIGLYDVLIAGEWPAAA